MCTDMYCNCSHQSSRALLGGERVPRGSLSTKYGGPCDTPDVGTISSESV